MSSIRLLFMFSVSRQHCEGALSVNSEIQVRMLIRKALFRKHKQGKINLFLSCFHVS